MQFPNRIRVVLRKTVSFSSPSGPWGGAYSIRPYDRIRVILRNTDAIFQLNTCGPSKNCFVFVPFGAAYGAYSIRPYNRVRVPLRNTDAIPRLGTCEGSKTDLYSKPSVAFGGHIRYAPTTGYVRSYEIPMRSPDRRNGGVWEVGRWGLPLAGEMGVDEFGEEEDDDQDDDDEGARGDLQHEREP